MKKKLLLLSIMLGCVFTMYAQVTSVNYQIIYNDATCQYDSYIIINAGSATTVPQRIQFNTQYSIVVPTGTDLTVTDTYMPLQSNATYTGTEPLLWVAGTPIISPAAQPESDFHSITPDLGITSHYNNLFAGDTIKLFSFTVDTIINCSLGIRIFDNDIDPKSDQPGMGMQDFSNGFTLGSINQIYNDNSTQLYPSEPEVISISNGCSNGLEIDLTAENSICQLPFTYLWTGPDGYTSTTEDVSISPALPVNSGIYKVVITDAFGCKDSITIDATSKPNAGPDLTACLGSTTTIYGTNPTTGTWSQSAENSFGASLSPLAGGATDVTFSSFASGTYDIVYSIPGCGDTMQFTVISDPIIDIEASQICINGETVATSNVTGGTWSSSDNSVATIDNDGIITGVGTGTATISFIVTNSGCSINESMVEVLPNNDPACLVGLDDLTETQIKVYPNPATNQFFIESESNLEAVSIYTMSYQKVKELDMSSSNHKIALSSEKLNPGMYVIAIKSEDRTVYKKLIIK